MNTDVIEKKVLLRAPLSRVWRALADSTEFGYWFGMKFDGPFSPGAIMHGTLTPTGVNADIANAQKPYEGLVFEIVIDRMESEKLFSFKWHPYAVERDVDYSVEPMTLIVFDLQEAENGVMLTITESGFDTIPLERRAKAFAANGGGLGNGGQITGGISWPTALTEVGWPTGRTQRRSSRRWAMKPGCASSSASATAGRCPSRG